MFFPSSVVLERCCGRSVASEVGTPLEHQSDDDDDDKYHDDDGDL